MNDQTKKILKHGLFTGLCFAGLMTAFDYYDGNDFNIWKFLFGFLFFGIVMGHRDATVLKNKRSKNKIKTSPYNDRNGYPSK